MDDKVYCASYICMCIGFSFEPLFFTGLYNNSLNIIELITLSSLSVLLMLLCLILFILLLTKLLRTFKFKNKEQKYNLLSLIISIMASAFTIIILIYNQIPLLSKIY